VWHRDGHDVTLTPDNQLTSTDLATGTVTVLTNPGDGVATSFVDNGHYIVFDYGNNGYDLIDTDLDTHRPVSGPKISADASRYLLLQQFVAPSGGDRIVFGPIPPP
jgi:hypothetical protein